MKSVLFINRVHPPAQGATGGLLAELAGALAGRGWQVSVIASRPVELAKPSLPTPNSPIAPFPDGVRIHWAGGLPFNKSSHWRRASCYLSLYPSLWWRALRAPRHNVTVFLSDPPLLHVFGPLLRRIKRTRIVHWAHDIYPEVAEQLGVIHPRGLLAGVLRRLSNYALRRFDCVVVVGACMRGRLLTRVLPGHRNPEAPSTVLEHGNLHSTQLQAQFASGLAVIPNWARPEAILPLSHDRNSFRHEHALNGRFVVMYSGNIGLAHSFEAILEAAALLQSIEPDLLFLFVGNGPRLPWVREESARRGLTNLRFIESQPHERLAESLSAADVHLVSLRDDLYGLVVPSKFYGIAAAGRPMVFLGPANSEVAREIVREQCGSVLSAATGAGLVKCLRGWRADAAARSAAGARARAHAERTGLRLATDSFETLLHQLLPDLTGRCSGP